MPSVAVDRNSALPLQIQICRAIAGQIRSGAIQRGARLPASRILAKVLGVSRNTVLAAYDELAAQLLIRGERGSGMRVEGSRKIPVPGAPALKDFLRAAHYPGKTLAVDDPDGNALCFRSD
jgi:GntR family transcriptional regulator/MocR family aminotransferase